MKKKIRFDRVSRMNESSARGSVDGRSSERSNICLRLILFNTTKIISACQRSIVDFRIHSIRILPHLFFSWSNQSSDSLSCFSNIKFSHSSFSTISSLHLDHQINAGISLIVSLAEINSFFIILSIRFRFCSYVCRNR